MRRGLLILLSAALLVAAAGAANTLPTKLGDRDFWELSARLSEPPGSFRSDNYVSNERQFQLVIPELTTRAIAGQAYVGVGPEQNFSYILAVRPRVAFIID